MKSVWGINLVVLEWRFFVMKFWNSFKKKLDGSVQKLRYTFFDWWRMWRKWNSEISSRYRINFCFGIYCLFIMCAVLMCTRLLECQPNWVDHTARELYRQIDRYTHTRVLDIKYLRLPIIWMFIWVFRFFRGAYVIVQRAYIKFMWK